MKTRASFTLLPLMHWISVVMLAGSAALALSGFMAMAAAVAGASVLTFLLKTLVEQAAESFIAKQRAQGILFAIGAMLIVCFTVALTAATLYAKVFALPSAISDWTLRREPLERELQRVLALGSTAQASMSDWAKDASAKAALEGQEGGGGSCPNLPKTEGKRGPVAKWREDDSTIAASLAAELKSLTDAAQASTATVVALPKPSEFLAVKAGYAAANEASDDISKLTGGGNYAADTVRVLEVRRISSIERPGLTATTCGDTARLTYIDRATVALGALAALKPMPRMQPGVDVSDPHDVLSRSLLRSFNGALAMATLGRAGSFNGDHLMQDALKKNGMINIETLAFAISILAEVALVLTSLLMVLQGRAPYADNVVSWIDGDEQRHPSPGPVRTMARGLAKRLANLFYAEKPAANGTISLDTRAPEAAASTGFGNVDLFDDPACRAREVQWAQPLLPFHFPWGDSDFVVLPIAPDTRQVRRMAHALRAQGQFDCISASAPAKALADKPDMVAHMQQQYGDEWRRMQYEIFEVRPAYAQVLRLQDIGNALVPVQALPQTPADPPWAVPQRHLPLSHRLAQRPAPRRGLWH